MSAKGRKPNLFIVGAPKSGTTALWTYLRQHPEIFTAGKEHLASDLPAAGGKEYQYFGSDLASNIDTRRTLESYMAVSRRPRTSGICWTRHPCTCALISQRRRSPRSHPRRGPSPCSATRWT